MFAASPRDALWVLKGGRGSVLIGTQSNKASTGGSQILSFLTSWREWLVRTQGSPGLDVTVLMRYVPHTPALRSVSWTYHIASLKHLRKE